MSRISELERILAYEKLRKRQRRLQDAIFALSDIDEHPDIQEELKKELNEVTEKIKNYWKETEEPASKKILLDKEDYEIYSGRSFDEDFSKRHK